MRIKIFLKMLKSISVAVISTVALAGCMDLGDFSDEEEYYDTFGDVRLVYQNPDADEKDIEYEDYSVEDYFYNKNTGEKFSYGNPKDEESDEGKDIPQLSYVYMAIPVEQDLRIESFALYFNATQTCSMEVFFYVVNELPNGGNFKNIWLLGEPEYQQKPDNNGGTESEKIEYSDPNEDCIVAKATMQVKAGKWDALIVDDWYGNSDLEIKEDQYLLLRFINNSGANTTGNVPVAFRTTNLLIRAFPKRT